MKKLGDFVGNVISKIVVLKNLCPGFSQHDFLQIPFVISGLNKSLKNTLLSATLSA